MHPKPDVDHILRLDPSCIMPLATMTSTVTKRVTNVLHPLFSSNSCYPESPTRLTAPTSRKVRSTLVGLPTSALSRRGTPSTRLGVSGIKARGTVTARRASPATRTKRRSHRGSDCASPWSSSLSSSLCLWLSLLFIWQVRWSTFRLYCFPEL